MDGKMKAPEKALSYTEAMEVQTAAEAAAYFERLVASCMSSGKPRYICEEIQRKNLGYFAGYYDDKTRERVERLYKCSHPIFGPITYAGPPTPKQAFEMGKRLGAKLKRKRHHETHP